MVAFVVGAVLPLLDDHLQPRAVRHPVTVVSVAAALALTGWVERAPRPQPRRRAPSLRNVGGGLLAMGVTYAIGALVGVSLG